MKSVETKVLTVKVKRVKAGLRKWTEKSAEFERYLDDGVVRIWLIVKYDVSSDAAILDGRDHQRHGLAVVDVDQRRGRRDRGRAIVVRRDSAEGSVVVDRGQDQSDLVLDVLVVG